MSDAPKVLIADDEQACIDFVRESLTDLDCDVLGAMDGERALHVARESKPDVIILDVQMPKKSGFEVFVDLKADDALAKVPVIMLTAVTARIGLKFSAKDMGEYTGAEPEAYIDKPIEPIVLRQTVKRLLKAAASA